MTKVTINKRMAKIAINKMVKGSKYSVLCNTKISCTEHTMTLSTTNLSTLVNVSIPCTWDTYQTDITCLVETSLLKTILNINNRQELLTISFAQDEEYLYPSQMIIEDSGKTYKVKCDTHVDEFINTTCKDGIREIHTTWDVLQTAISHIRHAAAQDEDRPVFTSIFFQLPHVVTADTFRLSIYDTGIIDDRPIPEKFPWILVPEKQLSLMLKDICTGEVTLSVIPNQEQRTIHEFPFAYILFEWMEGDISIQTRMCLIAGTYPNWQTIVPKKATISCQFPQICEEIAILAKVSDETLHIVLLQTHDNQLTCSVDVGGVQEGLSISLPCIIPDGIDSKYNGNYLSDALKLMENPWIHYTDNITPVLFVDGPFQEVIMPLYSRR